MSEDLTALASAYVDGELTADERARVEADTELVAEVERLRRVRAALAEREPTSISMREQHLANALGAWDALSSDARPGESRTSSTPPSGIRRRRLSSTGWLGLAAAGLVLVVGAGFVLSNNGNGNGGGDAAESASSAVQSVAPAGEALGADAKSAPDVAGQVTASATAPLPGPDINSDVGVAAPPPEIGDLAQLSGPDDLAAFAASAVGAPSAAELPKGATLVTEAPAVADTVADAAGNAAAGSAEAGSAAGGAGSLKRLGALPRCSGVDQVVGLAAYRGTEVVVGIDDNRHLAIASRQKDCSEVAQAPLP